MSLTCSECKLTRQTRYFSPCMRGKSEDKVTCRPCGREKNRERIEAREAGLRRCVGCKAAKPSGAFGNSTPTQLNSRCRPCMNKMARERKRRLDAAATHFQCKKCKQKKPRDDFSWSKSYRRSACKACEAERVAMGRLTPGSQYSQARGVARQRNLAFDLSFDEYTAIRRRPCHYCGHKLHDGGTGLDRLDNDKGYVRGNVVPSCWECNQARSVLFTPEEMLVIGEAIGRVKAARAAAGVVGGRARGWGRPRKYAYSL